MDLNRINDITQTQCGFSVFGPRELEWGNTYRGGTDSLGRIWKRDAELFIVRPLSEKELNATDQEIAELCIAQFQSFADQNYTRDAIVIQNGKSGQPSICVFAYSNLIKFIGKV